MRASYYTIISFVLFSECDQQLRTELPHPYASPHDLQSRLPPRKYDNGGCDIRSVC